MCDRDQALPIDVRHKLYKSNDNDESDKLELDTFSVVIASTTMLIHEISENLNGKPSSSINLGVFMLPRISKQQNRKTEIFRTLV